MRKGLAIAFSALAFALMALPAMATPISVTISGPGSVTLGCGCHNVVWTAVPAGGDPPYIEYYWTFDGASVPGSQPTLTHQYCNYSNQEKVVNSTVAVTVEDSNGRSASASKNATITLTGCNY